MALGFGKGKEEDVVSLIAAKKYARAIEVLKAQLQKKGANPSLRMQLADVLILADKKQEAVSLLIPLADQFAREGFAAKAVSVLKKIQKVDPGRREVEERLARQIEEKQREATGLPLARPGGPARDEVSGFDEGPSLEIGMEPIAPMSAARWPDRASARGRGGVARHDAARRSVASARGSRRCRRSSSRRSLRLQRAPLPPRAAGRARGDPAHRGRGHRFRAGRARSRSVPPLPLRRPRTRPERSRPTRRSRTTTCSTSPTTATTTRRSTSRSRPSSSRARRRREPMSAGQFADELMGLVDSVFQEFQAAPPAGPAASGAAAAASADDEPHGGSQIVVSPLFRDFSVDEMVAVIQGLKLLSFERGAVILREGQGGGSLYMLTSGRVRAFKKGADGKQSPLGDLKEGAFFGEMSILTGQPRMASVVALSRCELLELDRPTLDGITKTHPHVWDVLREFAEKRRAAAQG